MIARLRAALRHPFGQATAVLVASYVVIRFGIPLLPGSALVPRSVVLQFMVTILVGVLIYVSDNEERWTRFKEPLRAVAVEPRLRVVRGLLLAALPLLVAYVAFGRVSASVAAPPNLRSIHPAPPAEISFQNRRIALTGLENPLRSEGDLAAHLAVGRRVYAQNCIPCHGDYLDGRGHYAHGFNPLPLNFQDNGTIAQLTESFVFWRVAKGGPGLPREGAPWNSAMPAWEDFLTEREIWAVVLYLYEQTGWKPRTWDEHGTEGSAGQHD